MVIKAGLSKGTLRIKLTAEKANTVQVNIRLDKITQPKEATKAPGYAESIFTDDHFNDYES